MTDLQQIEQTSGEQLIKLLRNLIFEANNQKIWQEFDQEQQHDILLLAAQSGLGPLIYYYLRQHEIVLDNDSPVNHQLFLTGTAMALQRQAQLKTIINLLDQANIETLLLKGAWTAEFLYPHPALRMMHDIDILIKPEAEKVAYKLIKATGYTPYAGEYDGPKHLPSLVPTNNRGLAIELHHDISNSSDLFKAKQLWQYSELREITGIKTRVFAPEMLLLHHCLHMVEEYFGNGIKNITEAAFMINKNLFDLDKLLKITAELKLDATLALSLAVIEQLFGITLAGANQKLPQVPVEIIDHSCNLICDKSVSYDKTSAMLVRECENRTLFSKIAFLIGRAFIHPAQIAGMYGCSKYSIKLPFYYLHRIMKYASAVPETWQVPQQDDAKLKSRKIGQHQRDLINFCKIGNYKSE